MFSPSVQGFNAPTGCFGNSHPVHASRHHASRFTFHFSIPYTSTLKLPRDYARAFLFATGRLFRRRPEFGACQVDSVVLGSSAIVRARGSVFKRLHHGQLVRRVFVPIVTVPSPQEQNASSVPRSNLVASHALANGHAGQPPCRRAGSIFSITINLLPQPRNSR